MIGTHADLITPEVGGVFRLGALHQIRIFLLLPTVHRFGVPLIGLAHRLLRRESPCLEIIVAPFAWIPSRRTFERLVRAQHRPSTRQTASEDALERDLESSGAFSPLANL
jgi:hypothetical protein